MTLRLSPSQRVDALRCAQCGGKIERVYGEIYEDEARVGVYSADLDTETHREPVLISIGTQCWDDRAATLERCNVTVEVRETASEYQMAFVEADASPYKDTGMLGRVLGRAEALASPQRDWLFSRPRSYHAGGPACANARQRGGRPIIARRDGMSSTQS
jgi:hypothetical protein